jgi:mono/diheme cytochrome c family protein
MVRAPNLISPLLVLVALLALVAVASGCGTSDADPQRGRELFRVKCGTCHTMAQAGTSAQVGPNLDHAFAAARAVGDVAAYVGEWAGVPGAAPPKVPGGPGAQVFASAGCDACHTFAAAEAGGATGPNLDEVLPGESQAHVEEMIKDPNAEIAKGYPPNVMPQIYEQTLSAKEIEDLAKYLIENAGGAGKSKS